MDRKNDTNNRIETFKNFAIMSKNSAGFNLFERNHDTIDINFIKRNF